MAEGQMNVTDFRFSADELRELTEIAEILGDSLPMSLVLQIIRDLRQADAGKNQSSPMTPPD